ncbi:hypothetical protein [Streptomyces eurythermus]|uniref:hypothetical protein n=1 Tax=Streptomyces eurythermus TaxID=42237 RepID=UPI0033D7E34B
MTLAEAAQRCGQELFELARRPGFPEPEASSGGTEFYSWREIAAWLTRAGHDVPGDSVTCAAGQSYSGSPQLWQVDSPSS